MKFLFVMDPIETVKPSKDTSYYLMLAAFQEGHEVYHAQPSELFYHDKVSVRATKYTIQANQNDFTYKDVFLEPTHVVRAVDDFHVVMIRKDPPFDDRYLFVTRLLQLCQKPFIVNSPRGLQEWNEKLAALHFRKWTPWTFVGESADEAVAAMQEKGGRFVLKPLDGFGGRGIEFISVDEKHAIGRVQAYFRSAGKACVVQEYLAEAREGDKRILFWMGKPLGAVLRLHGDESELNNLDAGGSAIKSEITPNEMKMCEDLGPEFMKRGLYFVGIDVIGERLTEVNITSPTTLQEMSRFSGRDLHIEMIRSLTRRFS